MAKNKYFAHESPLGSTPTSRAAATGYPTQKIIGNMILTGVGENILMISDIISPIESWIVPDALATEIVNDWMTHLVIELTS